MAEGLISEKQLDFKEDEDEELGPIDPEQKKKHDWKKYGKLKALQAKIAERDAPKLNSEQMKEKMKKDKEQEIADEIAKSKEESPTNMVPKKKVVPPASEAPEAPALPPTASDLPPELAGALPQKAAPPAEKPPAAEGLPPELAGALPPELAGALAQHKTKHRGYESDSDSDSSDSDSDSD